MTEMQDALDRQSVLYVMTTLTKARIERGLKRQEVADRMGVHVGRVHDFDERRTPWQSIALMFFIHYAHAVGISLGIVFADKPEGETQDAHASEDA